MPDFVAGDVTIIVQERYARGGSKQRRHRVRIAFGDGALTYPAGGIPLPNYAMFGLQQRLDFLVMTDTSDDQGILWKFDQDNLKLQGFIQGVVTSAAGAGTLDDYPLDGTADPLAAAARQPSNGAVSVGLVASAAGVVYFGALKELLAAEHAPAAQTLYAEAVGW
jgi:hypothetical protein